MSASTWVIGKAFPIAVRPAGNALIGKKEPAKPAGEHAGVLAMRDGTIVALVMVSVREGRVDHIDALVDPVKLAPVSDALGIEPDEQRER